MSGFVVGENEVNDFGYKLLAEGEQKEALKIFKLNIKILMLRNKQRN
jgi:hypothetical protein